MGIFDSLGFWVSEVVRASEFEIRLFRNYQLFHLTRLSSCSSDLSRWVILISALRIKRRPLPGRVFCVFFTTANRVCTVLAKKAEPVSLYGRLACYTVSCAHISFNRHRTCALKLSLNIIPILGWPEQQILP